MITGSVGPGWKRIASIVASTLLVAGCASTPDTPMTPESEQPEVAVETEDEVLKTLEGTSWQAVSVLGKPASAAASRLSFDPGRVSGNAGCNNFQGGIELEGQSLRFGDLATTRKMCEPSVNGQETVFLEALSLTRSWTLAGDRLELLDQNNAVLMQLDPD